MHPYICKPRSRLICQRDNIHSRPQSAPTVVYDEFGATHCARVFYLYLSLQFNCSEGRHTSLHSVRRNLSIVGCNARHMWTRTLTRAHTNWRAGKHVPARRHTHGRTHACVHHTLTYTRAHARTRVHNTNTYAYPKLRML